MLVPQSRPLRLAGRLVVLALLLHPESFSQIRIPVTVTDRAGHSAVVQFGFDGLATPCIDPELGEFELPPGGCTDPFVCASFRDVRNDTSACLGEGLLLDLRPFGSASDTFRLALASPGSAVVLRWVIGTDAHFDSLRVVDILGGVSVNLDMLATDSLAYDPSLSSELFIVAWAPAYVSGLAAGEAEVPARAPLLTNYPNPFNPSTVIRYRLAARGPVRLAVYDLLGREVTQLVDGVEEAGEHAVTWDAMNASSGWYACRLTAGGAVRTLVMVQTR